MAVNLSLLLKFLRFGQSLSQRFLFPVSKPKSQRIVLAISWIGSSAILGSFKVHLAQRVNLLYHKIFLFAQSLPFDFKPILRKKPTLGK